MYASVVQTAMESNGESRPSLFDDRGKATANMAWLNIFLSVFNMAGINFFSLFVKYGCVGRAVFSNAP